jgi:hypothetical protein
LQTAQLRKRRGGHAETTSTGQGAPEFDEGEQLGNDQAAWQEATLVAGELFKEVDGKLTPEILGSWRCSMNIAVRYIPSTSQGRSYASAVFTSWEVIR